MTFRRWAIWSVVTIMTIVCGQVRTNAQTLRRLPPVASEQSAWQGEPVLRTAQLPDPHLRGGLPEVVILPDEQPLPAPDPDVVPLQHPLHTCNPHEIHLGNSHELHLSEDLPLGPAMPVWPNQELVPLTTPETKIPADFQPWWSRAVGNQSRDGSAPYTLGLHQLILETLIYSQQVQAIGEEPLIRETAIVEADAEFDGQAFMESKFGKSSDPVGDTLTTGGPTRFRESDWNYTAGVRKRSRHGGNLELSQRIGYLDNNSLFLSPTQQGNAQLTLSFEQPLLRGAGKVYNTSLIVLAELDTRVAQDQAVAEIQDYLLEVTRSYWELYLQRAARAQLQKSYERAKEILDYLEQRQNFDVLKSQIVIAQAAVASRESELIRAAASIRNIEARIRALANSPEFIYSENLEMLPEQPPSCDFIPVSVRDAMVTAMNHRPEVDQAMQQVESASVRLNMSRNELMPALSVVLETYVAGLEGASRVGGAYQNQFDEGEPGYSAGLIFEVPLYNRAARARYERRERELRQVTLRLTSLIETLKTNVEVAVREVRTSYGEMQGKYVAMQASQAEVDFMTQRWQLLPGVDRAASFLLEDLLAAQERLAREEFSFARAQVSYAIALYELKRAMGVLLESE